MANQRTILGIVLAAVVIIALGVFLVFRAVRGGDSGSSKDPGLQARARAMLPSLDEPVQKLPIVDATLNSWKAWVYDVQGTFTTITRGERGPIFEQILMTDSSVMPPQGVVLNEPRHPVVAVDPALTSRVAQTGKSESASVHSGGDFRVYVTPLKVPAVLQGAIASGVLEVLQPQ